MVWCIMEITVIKDNNKRFCSVCRRRIRKSEIIVRYDYLIDEWKNSRKWFSHISCLVKRLQSIETEIKQRLEKIPDIHYELRRIEK